MMIQVSYGLLPLWFWGRRSCLARARLESPACECSSRRSHCWSHARPGSALRLSTSRSAASLTGAPIRLGFIHAPAQISRTFSVTASPSKLWRLDARGDAVTTDILWISVIGRERPNIPLSSGNSSRQQGGASGSTHRKRAAKVPYSKARCL